MNKRYFTTQETAKQTNLIRKTIRTTTCLKYDCDCENKSFLYPQIYRLLEDTKTLTTQTLQQCYIAAAIKSVFF